MWKEAINQGEDYPKQPNTRKKEKLYKWRWTAARIPILGGVIKEAITKIETSALQTSQHLEKTKLYIDKNLDNPNIPTSRKNKKEVIHQGGDNPKYDNIRKKLYIHKGEQVPNSTMIENTRHIRYTFVASPSTHTHTYTTIKLRIIVFCYGLVCLRS
jgi:hypothetical protein